MDNAARLYAELEARGIAYQRAEHYAVFTVDEIILPALNHSALGQYETRIWSPDLKSPANEKYVADFQKKFGKLPVFYGAQTYDGIVIVGDTSNGAAIRVLDEGAHHHHDHGHDHDHPDHGHR